MKALVRIAPHEVVEHERAPGSLHEGEAVQVFTQTKSLKKL